MDWMPFKDPFILSIPIKVRSTFNLTNFESTFNQFHKRLKLLNDQIVEYDEKFVKIRPKFEVLFFKRKQNTLKVQLQRENQDYENKLQKMKNDIDKVAHHFRTDVQSMSSHHFQKKKTLQRRKNNKFAPIKKYSVKRRVETEAKGE